MKQEYFPIIIAGLLILAYVLDATVNPLSISLVSPYHFFDPATLSKYTFTTTSLLIKSTALFIALLWFLSFLSFNKLTKGGIILFVSALMQLYALQDVAINSRVIPLEWSLALTLTGVILLIPAILYILAGLVGKAHHKITKDPYNVPGDDEEF